MGTLGLVMIVPLVQAASLAGLTRLWEGNYFRRSYISTRKFLFYNGTFSYLNETYIVLLTCCCIGVLYLRWDSPGNLLNSLLALLFGTLLLVYPVAVSVLYSRPASYKKILSRDSDFASRFGLLVKSLNFKRRGLQVVAYLALSLFRRLILVLTVVFGQKYPVFSLFSINVQTICIILTSGYIEPYK